MKCPNCGGEIPYQETKCPYCGSEFKEGINFGNQVRRKKSRNQKLEEVILEKSRPERVHKLLGRTVLITSVGSVLLMVLSFVLYSWMERPKEKELRADSPAAEFQTLFFDDEDYWYSSFCMDMDEFVDAAENGQLMERNHLSTLVKDAWHVIRNDDEMSEEAHQEAAELLEAFFGSYIGIAWEKLDFFKPENDLKFGYYPKDEDVEVILDQIETAMEERIK